MKSLKPWRRLLAGALLCTVALPTLAGEPEPAKAATLPAVEDFYGLPAVSDAVMSPDGLHVAMLVRNDAGERPRQCVAVLSTETGKLEHGQMCFPTGEITFLEWVNDRRLVFDRALDAMQSSTRARSGAVYAMDLDGSNMQMLINRDPEYSQDSGASQVRSRILSFEYEFLGTLRDGSDSILVLRSDIHWRSDSMSSEGEVEGTHPARLDTRSLKLSNLVDHAPEYAKQWVVDPAGVPQAATGWHGGEQMAYRREADGSWKLLSHEKQFSSAALLPVDADSEGTLYVDAWQGRDRLALYRVPPGATGPVGAPLIDVQGYDFQDSLPEGSGIHFEGGLRFDRVTHRLIGVDYSGDTYETHWLDADLQEVQKQVDAKLASTINYLQCGNCHSRRWFLVVAHSDRQPPVTLLFDRQKGSLAMIGASHPGIRPADMGARSISRIAARDGLEIPVWVTRPAHGNAPFPTVVLVHGGPWIRGEGWDWSDDAQFLASRGYLVVEPAFRGTSGYGRALFSGGIAQWGLAMQDDVADATRWAIKQGLADADRIAIAGASYGGYATLMGLIRDPDLYRSGFEWVGVTDIDLMLSPAWNDGSQDSLHFTTPALVGDPATHKEQFAATSPINRAAEIRQPLLMAYGGRDHRVPKEHGLRFRDAVQKTNHDVEWLLYPDEYHGWYLPETRKDFWPRVERFLARTLAPVPGGKAAQTSAAPTQSSATVTQPSAAPAQ